MKLSILTIQNRAKQSKAKEDNTIVYNQFIDATLHRGEVLLH